VCSTSGKLLEIYYEGCHYNMAGLAVASWEWFDCIKYNLTTFNGNSCGLQKNVYTVTEYRSTQTPFSTDMLEMQ